MGAYRSNRAYIAYRLDPIEFRVQRAVASGKNIRIEDVETVRITQPYQILKLGDFCNACGNCTTFCPTSGVPHLVKPQFYLDPERFENEPNGYMFMDGALKARVGSRVETLGRHEDRLIYETPEIRAHLNLNTYAAEEVTFLRGAGDPVDLRHAAQMAVLFTALKDFYLFVE